MNEKYQEWYKRHRKAVEDLWDKIEVDDDKKVNHLVDSLLEAVSKGDEDQIDVIIDATYEIKNDLTQVATLNELLLIKEHKKHQEITKAIQSFAHPSSVPSINRALETGFEHLAYNGSDSDVIAKWFSHALSCIGTKEAIDTIRKYANSSDEGVRNEMQYRLGKIN